MQKTNIGRGIIPLRFAEFGVAPITGLLLLRNILPEQLPDQLLQAVPIGIGSNKTRCDFRAKYRLCHHAHIMLDGGKIEPRKVI